MSAPKPHEHLVPRYVALKAMLRELHGEMLKALPTKVLKSAARRLGMLADRNTIVGGDTEMALLWDYSLYREPAGRTTFARRFCREMMTSKPAGDRVAVLEAVAGAHYRVMEVVSVERGVGVGVRDLLRGDELFIIDRGFGGTVGPGFLLASNVLEFPEFASTTGAALPIRPEEAGVVRGTLMTAGRHLAVAAKKRAKPVEILEEEEAGLAGLVIITAIAMGWTERVEYV